MASTFNSGTNSKLAGIISTIASMLGVEFDFSNSKGFHIQLDTTDGDTLVVRGQPDDQGSAFQKTAVPSTDMADAGGHSSALTAGAATINLANAVGDRLSVVKTATGGTAGDRYSVARVDASSVAVKSHVDATTASSALVAGTKDITLANLVGDRLAVLETVAGGTAAASFSVSRVNATTVRVQAHDAAGAFVAGNTSTVKVINSGPDTSLDTSTVEVFNFGPVG